MASSAANITNSTTSHSGVVGNTLPSLFVSDHNGGSSLVSSKDLDNLIAMNDSALSQQIEFILQEAPMEHDGDIINGDISANVERISSVNPNTTIKLQNPPNLIVTSASDFSRAHATSEGIVSIAGTQTMAQHHLLNGRRIIIQTTPAANMIKEEEADPELNDENLQDIEEEEQEAEAEENQLHLQHANIKMEQIDNGEQEYIRTGGINYISTPTITTHHTHLTAGQPQQIVLPAGSIVGTTATGRTVTVPVSEALAQLQRRPVYISNTMGGMTGATFVRMPAVISRSPMTVLNVVQQGVPGSGQTQLILQATPVANTGTQMTVVTSSPSAVATMPTLPPLTASNVEASAATTMPAVMPALTSTSAQSTSPSNSSSSPLSSSGHVASSTVVVTTAASAPANSSAINTTANCSGATNRTSSSATNGTYQCVSCAEEFESKELFDIHCSGHANNMKCAICNMVLKSLKNYEKHCLRCKPYECQICGRVVRFRPNFIKHMRVHTGQQSERHKYKCDVCHKEFMSFEYFKVHKKIHNENVNLTCEICGKVFSALASLRGHSKLHSGVKLHK